MELVGTQENRQVRKICRYCGYLADASALKCIRCHKWFGGELSRNLCEDNIRVVKDQDLDVHTPTSILNQLVDRIEGDTIDFLKKDKSVLKRYCLSDEERFNILLFVTFCYFNVVRSSVRIKPGHEHTILEMLLSASLKVVSELFNRLFGTRPSIGNYDERIKTLYDIFEVGLRQIDSRASIISEIEASEVFASAVFAERQPSLIRGLSLYELVGKAQQSHDGLARILVVEE
jgi:hypothetical protein